MTNKKNQTQINIKVKNPEKKLIKKNAEMLGFTSVSGFLKFAGKYPKRISALTKKI